jgi:hypothetical protein
MGGAPEGLDRATGLAGASVTRGAEGTVKLDKERPEAGRIRGSVAEAWQEDLAQAVSRGR